MANSTGMASRHGMVAAARAWGMGQHGHGAWGSTAGAAAQAVGLPREGRADAGCGRAEAAARDAGGLPNGPWPPRAGQVPWG